MTATALAARYALFAAVATLTNLATQHVALPLVGLGVAMAAGTATGLVAKYVLDKRWIFADRATGLAAQSHRFGLYTLTGGLTTALFWATELVFHSAFGSAPMRDVGAVLGLGLGYAAKYRLDRRFVFPAAAP